jgi:Spy/CpxP family protein refolding chaperone
MKKTKVMIVVIVATVSMLEVLVHGKLRKEGGKGIGEEIVKEEKKEKGNEMKLLEEKMAKGESLNAEDKKKLEEIIREIKEMEDVVYELKKSKKRKKLEAQRAEVEKLLLKEKEEEKKADEELSKMLSEDE